MKATVCRSFEQPLMIEEMRLAAPEKDHAHAKIDTCAICHSDIMFISGICRRNVIVFE